MNDRLFRALLRLYPRDTRERFGGEMVELWRWRRARSPGGAFPFWISTLFETLRAAPSAHLTEWAERLGWRPLPPTLRRRWRVVRDAVGPVPLLQAGLRAFHNGIRNLSRSPRFTFTATLLFTVCIAANTLVFGLLHTVLLGRLPCPEPERLVVIQRTAPGRDVSWMPISVADLEALEGSEGTLVGVAVAWYTTFTLTREGTPEVVDGAEVTANFTEVLGVQPLLGRGFRREDGEPDAERVVLMGEALWRERYGADPGVVGRVIMSGGAPATVVGILPAGFRLPRASLMWELAQVGADPTLENRSLTAVGRLAPGISVREASARLGSFVLTNSRRFPDIDANTVSLQGLQQWAFAESSRPIRVLYGLMSLILLLACLNVAGLLLARNETRLRELAIRISLGAGRMGMAGQLLAEGIVLAGVGGIAGIVLGRLGQDMALRLLPGGVSAPLVSGVGTSATLAMAGVVAFVGLLTSLPPTLTLVRADLRGALRPGGSSLSAWREGSRLRSILLMAEVALAIPVLAGAGLALESEMRRRSMDPGFHAEGVATMRVSFADVRWQDTDQRSALFRQVLGRVRALPDVRSAAFTATLPTGSMTRAVTIRLEGPSRDKPGPVLTLGGTECGSGYFSTLGIPMVGGREFEPADGFDGAGDVVIVNASLDAGLWPGKRPLGMRIATLDGVNGEPRWREIVGIVADIPNQGFFSTPAPQLYLPWEASDRRVGFLLVSTRGDPGPVAEEVRRAIRRIDGNIAVTQVSTLEREILSTNWEIPILFRAFGITALVALILAAVGVYGIVAFSVRVQVRETALKVALGGDPQALARRAVFRSLLLASVGMGAGLALSIATLPLVRGLLFGSSATGPGTYGVALGIMAGVVALASYLPTRRATGPDPVRVLNGD